MKTSCETNIKYFSQYFRVKVCKEYGFYYGISNTYIIGKPYIFYSHI